MRYGTWNVIFTDNVGTTPPTCEGAFYTDDTEHTIAGYLPTDLDLTTVSQWSVQEITSDQFLALLIARNPQGTLVDGRATTPQINDAATPST